MEEEAAVEVVVAEEEAEEVEAEEEEEEEAEAEAEGGAVEVVVEEAAAEIRHEKALGSPDAGPRPGQPPAPRQPAAAPPSGRRRARSSGRAGLAYPDAQQARTEVAFRLGQPWAAGRTVAPATPAGRPRRPEPPAARVRHARSSPRSNL